MKDFLFILLSPLVAATGAFPARRLSHYPRSSFIFATVLYVVVSYSTLFLYLPHPVTWPRFVVTSLLVLFYYSVVVMVYRPKWQVPLLLAWAGTDIFMWATGLYWFGWDMLLMIVYFIRGFLDKEPPKGLRQ